MPDLGGQVGAGRVDHLGAGPVQLVAGDGLGSAAWQGEVSPVMPPLSVHEHSSDGWAGGERVEDGHRRTTVGLVTLVCASRSIATMRWEGAAGEAALARGAGVGITESAQRCVHAARDGPVAWSDARLHERNLGGEPGGAGERNCRGGVRGEVVPLRNGLGSALNLRLTFSDGQLSGSDGVAAAGRGGGAEQEPEHEQSEEEGRGGERPPPVVSERHQTSRLQTSRAISLMGSLVERFLTRLRS